jgi:hypothetical protein
MGGVPRGYATSACRAVGWLLFRAEWSDARPPLPLRGYNFLYDIKAGSDRGPIVQVNSH